MNRITKVAAITAAAVFTSITLSACGSDPAPETTTETTTDTMPETMPAPEQTQLGTVVDVATQAGTFNTLVAAIGAAELGATLSAEGPFTVFAPTDEAFAALPAGVLDALLLPENKAVLAQILTYHVVAGKVYAADVTDGVVSTVEGSEILLSTADGVTINKTAKVVSADIEASNGVIHVINAVILPEGLDVAKLLK
jgi:uncharacterized surface protein with fasciclin (FAS1) repeats